MQIHRLQGALARAPPGIPPRLGPPAAPPEAAGRKRGRRLLPAPPRAGPAPETATATPGPRLPARADLRPEAGAEAARAGGGAEAVLQAEAAHRAHEQSSLKVRLLRCQFFKCYFASKNENRESASHEHHSSHHSHESHILHGSHGSPEAEAEGHHHGHSHELHSGGHSGAAAQQYFFLKIKF